MWQLIELSKKAISINKSSSAAQKVHHDDDLADRLSRRYTVAMLMICTAVVSSTLFVGSPINCWCPAEYTGSMVAYVNSVCWISTMYYVPPDQNVPEPDDPRQYRVNYYKWVPFLLCFMAVLFYAPHTFWTLLSERRAVKTGADIVSGIDPCDEEETRRKAVQNACRMFDRAMLLLYRQKVPRHKSMVSTSSSSCLFKWHMRAHILQNNGRYLTRLYVVTKVLYCFNIFVQFSLLNVFIGPGFASFGLQVVDQISRNRTVFVETETRFPRVTMCDFVLQQRNKSSVVQTVQCTLPLNLFNEKIFLIISCWLCFLAVVSVASLFEWLLALTKSSRRYFVKHMLTAPQYNISDRVIVAAVSPEPNDELFEGFVFDYLREDGVFMLRIIRKNTSEVVLCELVNGLWEHYKNTYVSSDIKNGLMEWTLCLPLDRQIGSQPLLATSNNNKQEQQQQQNTETV